MKRAPKGALLLSEKEVICKILNFNSKLSTLFKFLAKREVKLTPFFVVVQASEG
tara:strand:+ start:189 stop:350 length:162 start_codon:yes stop_codon:yes gene_type:complete